jgi:hypothetical protein
MKWSWWAEKIFYEIQYLVKSVVKLIYFMPARTFYQYYI